MKSALAAIAIAAGLLSPQAQARDMLVHTTGPSPSGVRFVVVLTSDQLPASECYGDRGGWAARLNPVNADGYSIGSVVSACWTANRKVDRITLSFGAKPDGSPMVRDVYLASDFDLTPSERVLAAR